MSGREPRGRGTIDVDTVYAIKYRTVDNLPPALGNLRPGPAKNYPPVSIYPRPVRLSRFATAVNRACAERLPSRHTGVLSQTAYVCKTRALSPPHRRCPQLPRPPSGRTRAERTHHINHSRRPGGVSRAGDGRPDANNRPVDTAVVGPASVLTRRDLKCRSLPGPAAATKQTAWRRRTGWRKGVG